MHKEELMPAQQAPAYAKGNFFDLTIININPNHDQRHKYIYPQGAPREIFQAVVGKAMPNNGFFRHCNILKYGKGWPSHHGKHSKAEFEIWYEEKKFQEDNGLFETDDYY
jgi:hypothetical protein